MELTPLHERLRAVLGNRTYRAIAELTGQNDETVRRYMQGGAPSTEFLATLCTKFDLSAQWLLMGHGPARQSDTKTHALREANPSELLAAIANALELLSSRVDRLELLLNTTETRLNALRAMPADGAAREGRAAAGGEATNHAPPTPPTAPAAPAPTPTSVEVRPISRRARDVADAVPKRPRPSAD
ncbi:MAG TPA: hypothetical protein VG797_05770 [Phycisphaerales bacterium]|nr:hypothetical protein [Phycisphaerales bacterium]